MVGVIECDQPAQPRYEPTIFPRTHSRSMFEWRPRATLDFAIDCVYNLVFDKDFKLCFHFDAEDVSLFMRNRT
jgi:hypothetical protein